VRGLAHRGRPWPAARTVAFLAGLVVVAGALASPLAAPADRSLTAHMWQHLLLTLVAAPLLVGGAPVSLLLRATRGDAHRAVRGLVRSRPARVVTHPLVTWSAFAVVNAATHLTGWYDVALRDSLLHGLEHVAFLGSALLFWAPVVGSGPLRAVRSWIGRTIYLLTAMVPMSTIAVMLVDEQRVRYPTYAARAARPLADQHAGGEIMWVLGSVWMVGAAVVIGAQALIREERRQRAIDALEDAAALSRGTAA
jgi:cytochrome c oxidase assembly factor CtaG